MILGIAFAAFLGVSSTALGDTVCELYKGPLGQGTPDIVVLKTSLTIPFDKTGIASHEVLNPRRPFPLAQSERLADEQAKSQSRGDCYELLDPVTLTFANRTDRFFGIQLSLHLKTGVLTTSANELFQEFSIEYQGDKLRVLETPGLASSLDAKMKEYETAVSLLTECRETIRQFEDLGRLRVLTDDFVTKLADCRDKVEGLKVNPTLPALSDKLGRFRKDLTRIANVLSQLPKLTPNKGREDLCKLDSGSRVLDCSPQLIVAPEASQSIPGNILSLLNDRGSASFTVSFISSADIPSNSTGYLQTARTVEEPADSTKWQLAAQLGALWDPDLGKKAEMRAFSAGVPFRGDSLQHFTGVGNFKITQRLGSRATAAATLGFKNGDLGEKDGTRQVTVPEYQVDLYGGLSGKNVQFVFGKYTLAAPSDAIAVNVVGEGFEIRLITSLSLGYLIKRESAFGEADHPNRDNSLFIAQYRNAVFSTANVLGAANLVALYGMEKSAQVNVPLGALLLDATHCPQSTAVSPPGSPAVQQACYGYHYYTFGGEVSLAKAQRPGEPAPMKALSGTLSLYYSQRNLDPSAIANTSGRVRDGRGYVGLFKPTFLRFEDGAKVTYTLGAEIGYGTGGSGKDRVDRGYVGEDTAFAPDQVFFNRLAGHLGNDVVDKTTDQPLAPGLSNKTYLALIWTSNRWSLLELPAQLLLSKDSQIGQATTVKLHEYRFNRSVFDRHDAGAEADLEFTLEAPKGITTSLDFGYFKPGSALRSVILRDAWVVSATVKATI